MASVTNISLSPSTVSPGENTTATVTLNSSYGEEKCDIRVEGAGTTLGYKSGVRIQGSTTTSLTIGSPIDTGSYNVCASTENCEVISP